MHGFCQQLGLQLPVIQAPMAGVQGSRLALAVCGAGGLGSLPAAMLSAEALLAELRLMQQAGPSGWNLNFFCHATPPPDAAQEARWRALLAPCYEALGLAQPPTLPAAARQPFSAALADLIEPFAPPVVSFHFGLPAPALLARVKRWGAVVLSSATTVDEARWLQARGADAVIAQGLEAGGHRGHFLSADLSRQAGLLALLPQIVDAVDLPVIAAGGIADGRAVRAALALGAAAVQVGTAYLLCPEADTSAVHRAALQSPAAAHTALTRLFTGRPARGIVNRLMRDMAAAEDQAPAFPLAGGASAPLRARAEQQGSGDFSPLWAGQRASACRVVDAASLTRSLAQPA